MNIRFSPHQENDRREINAWQTGGLYGSCIGTAQTY